MHTRDDAWVALDRSFKAFMDSLGHLTEEELTATEVVGKWSVKDVVAHVWSWVDESVLIAKRWSDAHPASNNVVYDDDWNQKHVDDKSLLPLISVVDGLTGAHRRLIHMLDLAEDSALAEIRKSPWDETEMSLADFYYDTAAHYEEHRTDLKNYQERCLEGCD